MALPNVPFAATTNPQMVYIDQLAAAIAALGIVPCSVTGDGNAIVLTGLTNTPSLAAYANHQQFSFVATAAPTSDVTIQFGGLGALKLYRAGQPTTQVTAAAWPSGTLVVVGYDSTRDSGAGGFSLVSAVQPALTPATAVEARAATNGSAVMTPSNLLNSPFTLAASATVGSGGTITAGHGLIGQKTGLGAWNVFFTSGRTPLASTYQVFLTNGSNVSNLFRIESPLLSGFSVVSPFYVGVVGNF
jgi:hypothetical protein